MCALVNESFTPLEICNILHTGGDVKRVNLRCCADLRVCLFSPPLACLAYIYSS